MDLKRGLRCRIMTYWSWRGAFFRSTRFERRRRNGSSRKLFGVSCCPACASAKNRALSWFESESRMSSIATTADLSKLVEAAEERISEGSLERIPAAIVGAGYIATYHLAVLRQLSGVEVVGACDPSQERLDAL